MERFDDLESNIRETREKGNASLVAGSTSRQRQGAGVLSLRTKVKTMDTEYGNAKVQPGWAGKRPLCAEGPMMSAFNVQWIVLLLAHESATPAFYVHNG